MRELSGSEQDNFKYSFSRRERGLGGNINGNHIEKLSKVADWRQMQGEEHNST